MEIQSRWSECSSERPRGECMSLAVFCAGPPRERNRLCSSASGCPERRRDGRAPTVLVVITGAADSGNFSIRGRVKGDDDRLSR